MPLAMSSANFTAWLWSTTRADEGTEDRGGKETRRQKREVKMGKQQSCGAFQFLHVHKLLTGALVEYVEERSVWHVMGNDDGMRGWRCLTGPENRQNVWMRKDPMETRQEKKEHV